MGNRAPHKEMFEVSLPGAHNNGYMSTSERNLWKAEVAALNKELTAVRKHMDWQAHRIHELELRLNTLGAK
jgi:hypothetical protein